LRSIGIQPDILLCRTDRRNPQGKSGRKLGLFCNVRESAVIEARDVDNIYACLTYHEPARCRGAGPRRIAPKIPRAAELERHQRAGDLRNSRRPVTIAIVGKIYRMKDAYKS